MYSKARKSGIESASFRIEDWVKWRMGVWEDEKAYYVIIPKGGLAKLRVRVNFQGRLEEVIREIAAYGIVDFYREVLTCPVFCADGNTTMAYIVFRNLYLSIKEYMVEEREALARLGFKADKYVQDINYSLSILLQGT